MDYMLGIPTPGNHLNSTFHMDNIAVPTMNNAGMVNVSVISSYSGYTGYPMPLDPDTLIKSEGVKMTEQIEENSYRMSQMKKKQKNKMNSLMKKYKYRKHRHTNKAPYGATSQTNSNKRNQYGAPSQSDSTQPHMKIPIPPAIANFFGGLIGGTGASKSQDNGYSKTTTQPTRYHKSTTNSHRMATAASYSYGASSNKHKMPMQTSKPHLKIPIPSKIANVLGGMLGDLPAPTSGYGPSTTKKPITIIPPIVHEVKALTKTLIHSPNIKKVAVCASLLGILAAVIIAQNVKPDDEGDDGRFKRSVTNGTYISQAQKQYSQFQSILGNEDCLVTLLCEMITNRSSTQRRRKTNNQRHRRQRIRHGRSAISVLQHFKSLFTELSAAESRGEGACGTISQHLQCPIKKNFAYSQLRDKLGSIVRK